MFDYFIALDQILTQLMEQSQGDKPVPAPEDVIARLSRSPVTVGSTYLSYAFLDRKSVV